jgi:hypothetical protein
VEDDLPEDGQWVWHCFKNVRHWQYGQYRRVFGGGFGAPTTHWVPEIVLPEMVGEDESEDD